MSEPLLYVGGRMGGQTCRLPRPGLENAQLEPPGGDEALPVVRWIGKKCGSVVSIVSVVNFKHYRIYTDLYILHTTCGVLSH
jgi:hypothetical protein